MRNFFKRLSQKNAVSLPKTQTHVLAYETKPLLTFHGRPANQAILFDEISLDGKLRIRGGSVKESPFYTGDKGTISRSEIRSTEDLLAHTERALGISTTHLKSVAIRFSNEHGDTGAIHAIDHSLVPSEDKKFIPHLLKDCVTEEQETVFCKSLPEEVYVGYWNNFSLRSSFIINPNYIDQTILSKQPELQSLFLDSIYGPYSIEIAPAIREKRITSAKEKQYEEGRKAFHSKYRFFVQQHLAIQSELEKEAPQKCVIKPPQFIKRDF